MMKLRKFFLFITLAIFSLFLTMLFRGTATHINKTQWNSSPEKLMYAIACAMIYIWIMRKLETLSLRNNQSSADEILWLDRRPPILLLRAFSSDNEFKLRRGPWLTSFFRTGSIRNLEYCLYEVLVCYGPLVAIGRPNEFLPPLGASRLYVPENEDAWKKYVYNFSEEATLIIIILGNSPGITWEYDLIFENNLFKKTIFILPPLKRFELEKTMSLFLSTTKKWGG